MCTIRVMRAARLLGPGRLEMAEVPPPEPQPGEIVVRTLLAAVCGSDVHVVYQDAPPELYPAPPGFPGHEGVGEVVESRSDRHRPGDLVLTTPVPALARGYADVQVLAGEQVVPVAPGADLAAVLMAQQMGTVVFALKRFWPGPPAETATVIGAGTAGLHFTRLLRRAGFGRIVVADRHPHRLAAARALGATVTVLAPDQSVVEATLDLTGGRGADLVVEAAGRDATRVQAVRAVADCGRIGLYGLPEDDEPALPFAELFRRRPTIEIASGAQRELGLASFREAVRLIETGEVDVSSLVTHRFDLADLPEAVALAREPSAGAIKVAITAG
jgi:L-iditol 2-dehydrogenase